MSKFNRTLIYEYVAKLPYVNLKDSIHLATLIEFGLPTIKLSSYAKTSPQTLKRINFNVIDKDLLEKIKNDVLSEFNFWGALACEKWKKGAITRRMLDDGHNKSYICRVYDIISEPIEITNKYQKFIYEHAYEYPSNLIDALKPLLTKFPEPTLEQLHAFTTVYPWFLPKAFAFAGIKSFRNIETDKEAYSILYDEYENSGTKNMPEMEKELNACKLKHDKIIKKFDSQLYSWIMAERGITENSLEKARQEDYQKIYKKYGVSQ